MNTTLIKLDTKLIKLDGATQSRAGMNWTIVQEYSESMRSGSTFPPVDVYHDGENYWLADGFHRVHAAKDVGLPVDAIVHQGTRRDAVLHSVGANAAHGLMRTNADKHRAVEVLLRDEEWVQWSDREIARRCGVGNDLVGKLRKMLTPSLSLEDSEKRTYTTKHGTTATMQTNGIGKSLAEIPSLDAEIKKSRQRQHELTKGDFFAAVTEHGDGVIMPDVEATLPEILQESECSEEEYMLDNDNEEDKDDDEDELESFMPYTVYAACNAEQMDYLIDNLGSRAVGQQFVDLVPECKEDVRSFYPRIDEIVRAEFGDEVVATPTVNLMGMVEDIKQVSPERLAWIIGYAANNNGLSDDHLKAVIKVCKLELNKRHHPEYMEKTA